jgi:hypothetical protein
MYTTRRNDRPAGGTIRLAAAAIAFFAMIGATGTAVASPVTTYTGGGTGALKDTVKLRVSSSKVVSYAVNVETLCGQVNLDGNQTAVWPVTPLAGEAPLKLGRNRNFSGRQRQTTTISAIHNLTTEPAPGTYSFSISGRLNRARSKIEGHLSLQIETTTGYFCTATSSPFTAKSK